MSGSDYWRNAVGPDGWNRLVSWRGGCDIDVPSRIDSDAGKRLAIRIGEAAAETLIALAGGTRLYILADAKGAAAVRYAAIRAMHQAGMTADTIAKEYSYQSRYTTRQIRAILAGSASGTGAG